MKEQLSKLQTALESSGYHYSHSAPGAVEGSMDLCFEIRPPANRLDAIAEFKKRLAETGLAHELIHIFAASPHNAVLVRSVRLHSPCSASAKDEN